MKNPKPFQNLKKTHVFKALSWAILLLLFAACGGGGGGGGGGSSSPAAPDAIKISYPEITYRYNDASLNNASLTPESSPKISNPFPDRVAAGDFTYAIEGIEKGTDYTTDIPSGISVDSSTGVVTLTSDLTTDEYTVESYTVHVVGDASTDAPYDVNIKTTAKFNIIAPDALATLSGNITYPEVVIQSGGSDGTSTPDMNTVMPLGADVAGFTFSIVGDHSNDISIDPNTGIITVNSTLAPVASLEIQVDATPDNPSDGSNGGPYLDNQSVSGTVSVTVTTEGPIPGDFEYDLKDILVTNPRDGNPGTTRGIVKSPASNTRPIIETNQATPKFSSVAIDPTNDLLFSITSGSRDGISIDENTGVITVASTLEYTDHVVEITAEPKDKTKFSGTLVAELFVHSDRILTYSGTGIIGKGAESGTFKNDDVLFTIYDLKDENDTYTMTMHDAAGDPTGTTVNIDSENGILEVTKEKFDYTGLSLTTSGVTPYLVKLEDTSGNQINVIFYYAESMISHPQDLLGIASEDGSGKNYFLTRDISTDSSNWEPIGDENNSNMFSGNFDGLGHTITGLQSDQTGDTNDATNTNIGLFGSVASGATVKNLNVVLAPEGIRGNIQVGGIAGSNAGTISNVSVTGSGAISGVGTDGTGSTNFSGTRAGGLVGENTGTLVGYATVNVSGVGNNVGGLVGRNNSGPVTGYATGEVKIENNTGITHYTGGLVGHNKGGPVTGYATGPVTGLSDVGGLVGKDDGTTKGYSMGEVTGNNFIGGLIGTFGGSSNNLIGYSRGVVIRATDPNGTSYVGKSIGFSSVDTISFVSDTESKVYKSDGSTELTGTGENGTPVTIDSADDEVTIEGYFTNNPGSSFTFGTAVGEWTATAGQWPSINLGNESVFDGLTQPTTPAATTTP